MTHRELLEIVEEARDGLPATDMSSGLARTVLDRIAAVIREKLGDEPKEPS